MSLKRWALVIVLIGGVAYLSLSGVAAQATAVARDLAATAGPAGPFVFAAFYAVATVLAFPGLPMTVLAGVLFGPAVGSASVIVGATVGATAAFALGRWLARDRVRALLDRRLGRLSRLDRWMTGRGFASILLLRLVPVVPFNALNYAAGLSGVRMRDYVPATGIGIIPGVIVYAALGGTIQDPTSPAFLTAVGLFVALTVTTVFLRRRFAPEAPVADDTPPDPALTGDTPTAQR